MVELVDTADSKSASREWGFESLLGYQKSLILKKINKVA